MAAETDLHWNAFGATLAAVRAELFAAAPDAVTAAEGEAYLMRVSTACLDDAFLNHLRTEGGLTRALPTRGGPNPDYIMLSAGIDPARHYRIEGCLNDSERVAVGLYAVDARGVIKVEGYAVFNRSTVGAAGRFYLDLGAGLNGAGTLAMTSSSRVLLVRILHRDSTGKPGTLKITGGADPDLVPALVNTEQALKCAVQAAQRAVRQYLRWSVVTSSHPNQFIEPPPDMAEEVRAEPDTTYGLGYYELAEGEWLEVLIPEELGGYWSVHAYNHWCESLPGASSHDQNAIVDPDGRIRIRIGPSLPTELLNRIHTRGRQRGVLIFRAFNADTTQLPFAELRR